MIFLEEPEGFTPRMEVAGLCMICGNEIMLLRRAQHKPQGGTWGMPGGKVDPGETPAQAIQREIREETGVSFSISELQYFKKIYASHDGYDLIYHMYSVNLPVKPQIVISASEHTDVIWIDHGEIARLPLIHDMQACRDLYFWVS